LASYAGGTTNLSTKIANPYYSKTVGGYPSTPFGIIAQPTVALGQTLLPFPQFQAVTVTENIGHSQYNALDVKLQKGFRKGLTAPGFNNSDISFNKSFKVTGKVNFQFCAEPSMPSTRQSSVSPVTS
jgi:hypothetical protein